MPGNKGMQVKMHHLRKKENTAMEEQKRIE
jgi:hypothetical protein